VPVFDGVDNLECGAGDDIFEFRDGYQLSGYIHGGTGQNTLDYSAYTSDPDPAVMLPADYTFSADDQGTHRFTGEFTLITLGTWTLTTADLANGLSHDVLVTVDT
jgi:hypothetical protein